MRIKARSIRSKFTLVFILAVGVILIMQEADHVRDYHRAKAACISSQRAVAKTIASALAHRVASLKEVHQRWALKIARGKLSTGSVRWGFEDLNNDTALKASSIFMPLPRSADSLKQPEISRTSVTGINDNGGRPTITLRTQVRTIKGEAGYLVTHMDANVLFDCMPGPEGADGWSMCGLVSPTGSLVVTKNYKRHLPHNGAADFVFDDPKARARLYGRLGSDSDNIGVVQDVEGTGWKVVVTQRSTVAMAEVRRERTWLAVSEITAIIGLAAAFVVGNRLVHSIRRLMLGAKALAVGDYRRRIRIETGDELESLGSSFNALGESLIGHETRLKEQAEMLAGMVEAARVASSSLDIKECGKAIAKSVCTHLGATDAAVFRKDKKNGGVEVIGQHGRRHRAAWKRLASHSADSGEYLLITELDPKQAGSDTPAEALLVGAPLATGSGSLGAIVARFGDGLTRDDLRLGSLRADVLIAFAVHCAAAVRNAELHLSTEAYSEVLEGWVEHVSAVLQVTDAISPNLDLDGALEALARATVSVVGADECAIFLPDRHGHLTVRSCYCGEARKIELYQLSLAPGESATGTAYTEKRSVTYYDASSSSDPLTRKLAEESRLKGILCTPLIVGEQAIGVITLYCFQPREFLQSEIQLMMSIALHAAVLIRNASLYTREASIAETLQRALMSEAPEECRGLGFASKYIPALNEARVGGDFYDVIPLPDGRVAVVIADVSGKGLMAAIHLAACKYMLKALVFTHPDNPAAVMTGLNESMNHYFQQSFFVTMFYAVIDPARGTLSYANAGHPPAFLITEKANMHTRLPSTGVPVGSGAACVYESRRIDVKPGDLLLLYTDGVTDAVRGGERLELEGLHRMVFQAGNCRASELVDSLCDQLECETGLPQKDDIALLAVSFEGVAALVGSIKETDGVLAG